MGLLYYYKDKNDKQQGPFDANQIRELIKIGAILPLTDLRTDQMDDRWVHAFNLKNAFPDYVPSQEQPSPPQKTWGTRYAIHLLKNPVMIIAILGAFGMVLAAYRARELPWLFPPNKMPSPVASVELEKPAEPLVNEDAAEEKERREEPKPADPLAGNTPAGQIHRGIMGDQWCIQPSRMFPLTYRAEGRFFFDDGKGRVFFSAKDPMVNLNPNAWPLPGMLISDYASYGQKPAMCHIKSYSQFNRHLSRIASTLEGLLVIGRLDDWKDLAGQDSKINYQINTSLRPIFPSQVESLPSGNVFAVYDSPKVLDFQRVEEVSIAISKPPKARGSRMKIALSAMYPAKEAIEEGKSSRLHKYHRLTMVSPQGQILADRYGETLSSLGSDRAAQEEASFYQQLVFSRNADYLAGYKRTGEIDIYHADTLKLLFTVPGVHMGGPYHCKKGEEVAQFAGHRLSFSEQEDLLLANDRGQVVLIDIRTEEIHRYPLRGMVQTCCFDKSGYIMAASTETGEVYRINPYSGEVLVKTLLAGLGPLTAYLNFSVDGDYLSGIFDEGLFVVSTADRHGNDPAKYAMFWDLNLLNDPSSKVDNQSVWSCQHPYRDEFPGQQGSFVGFARPNLGTLSVMVTDEATDEITTFPMRALTPESQEKAILLHSLVERNESSDFFDPQESVYTYEIPEWKPIAKTPLPHDQDKRYTARSGQTSHPRKRASAESRRDYQPMELFESLEDDEDY